MQGLHCKSEMTERNVFSLKMRPFGEQNTVLFYGSNLAPLINTVQLPRDYLDPTWLKYVTEWVSIGLNCAQMAPGKAESDFGLQGRVSTLGLKKIF